MNKNINLFLKKLLTDEELRAKFEAAKSPEEAYQLACSVQDGFTMKEFVEAMQVLYGADNADITDEDLAAAAGGEGGPDDVEYWYSLTEGAADSISKGTKKASEYVSKVSENVSKAIKNALP